MGCLFACFSACNHKKRRHLVHVSPSKHQGDGADESMQLVEESTKLQVPEEPIKPPAESNDASMVKLEEQCGCNVQKKVTFDLDVKAYEALSAKDEVADGAVKKNEEEKSENKEELANESKTVASTLTSYPPNHRYQNYARGEEYEELDTSDSELDANGSEGGGHDDDDHDSVQAESSESLFSLSIDSRKQMPGAELGEKEVSSPMPIFGSPDEEHSAVISNEDGRDRNLCVVDSVLNPVENIIQWKSVKIRPNLPLQNQDKENIRLVEQDFRAAISSEPDFKLMIHDSKVDTDKKMMVDPETAVDTSLSSWLATPTSNRSVGSVGNSPFGRRESSSVLSHDDDRPILGALTVVELKGLCASTPPRRAKSRSPDETPVVGTVGRYWIHTGRAMDSDSGSSGRGLPNTLIKNRADETEKMDITPFKARLESAVAQV